MERLRGDGCVGRGSAVAPGRGTDRRRAVSLRTASSLAYFGMSTGIFDRITFASNIMGGRACIRGMRITVSLAVNLVANGMSTDEIIREYPDLDAEDVRQALSYAS